MKASDKPEISRGFLERLPKDFKCPELQKAVAICEKALKGSDAKSTMAALKSLRSAAASSIKRCDKRKHKDLIAVLKRFDPLINDHEAQLVKSRSGEPAKAGAEADEPDDDGLSGQAHIKKMMKLMRSTEKELYFALGLNTSQPEATTLLLSRKKKGEQLLKVLKRKNSKENLKLTNKQLLYGVAKVDPDSKKTLYLDLLGGDHPQLMEKGKNWLRSDKSLLFTRLKYRCGDNTFEDSETDADEMVVRTRGQADDAEQKRSETRRGRRERLNDVRSRANALRQRLDRLVTEGRARR